MESKYITVSQINKYINSKMRLDDTLNDITIMGEISNFKTYSSGHSYFTLKDDSSQISGVMFKNFRQYLDFEPENGMKVVIHGYIEVYEKNGNYQLYTRKMTKSGIGDLYIAYEKLKKKLADEGLFDEDHKKKIPTYPKRIGVVTASTGAAVRDIITTINRRYPQCEILVFSTLVQGDLAKFNIAKQIKNAQNYDLDTLIVGRGGGSMEDLWAFNEEIVAREIYDCTIPVISAVGHETDNTICDFVADLRAATPTAAAERAVPDINAIKKELDQYNIRLNNYMEEKITKNKNKLREIVNKQIFKNPESIYGVKRMQLDNIINKFDSISNKIITDNRNKLFKLENSIILKNPYEITKSKKEEYMRLIGKLEVLNPLLTLKRGYSITRSEDKIVSSVSEVDVGDKLDIEFDDGTIHTKVI